MNAIARGLGLKVTRSQLKDFVESPIAALREKGQLSSPEGPLPSSRITGAVNWRPPYRALDSWSAPSPQQKSNGSKNMVDLIRRVIWAPREGPQIALVDCLFREIFFGGARGGG